MANPTLDLNAATHEEDPQLDPTIKTLDPMESKPDLAAAAAKENKNGETTKMTAAASALLGDSDVEKKMKRAERFGVTVQLTEEEKRNSRAQRFGTTSNVQASESKSAEEQKKKARAERFGLPVPSTSSDEEAKKKARLDRFGSSSKKVSSEEEEKRKARAIRFASPQSVSSPQMRGNEDIEPKAAVAGKATGGA